MRNIIKDLWENSPDSVGILAPTISKLWSCEHLNVIYTLDVGRSISFLTFPHHQSRRTFSIFRFLQRMVVTSAAARIATLESVHYPNDREERRKKKQRDILEPKTSQRCWFYSFFITISYVHCMFVDAVWHQNKWGYLLHLYICWPYLDCLSLFCCMLFFSFSPPSPFSSTHSLSYFIFHSLSFYKYG